jgi:transposase-like protein
LPGGRVVQIAGDLGVSDQVIYAWRQQLIDSGQIPGITSGDPSPLLRGRLTYTNWRGRLPVNALVRYGD